MKFCGQVQCVTSTNCLDLGEDLDLDLTTRFFKSDYSPSRDMAKLIYNITSQKVVDGFGQNFVDTLGVQQGRSDSIFVKI